MMSWFNLSVTTLTALIIVLLITGCDKSAYYYIVGDCERVIVSSVPLNGIGLRPLLNPDECEERTYGN